MSKTSQEHPLKKKKSLLVFALVALISGVSFLERGASITGNAIINKYQTYSALSIIGLLLMLCSIILVAYYFHRHK